MAEAGGRADGKHMPPALGVRSAATVLSAAAANGKKAKLRVLIVDERQLLANAFQFALAQNDMDVLGVATSGEQAASAIALGLPDVVVLCLWTQNGASHDSAAVAGRVQNVRGEVAPILAGLTPRELQVLRLLVEGTSNKEVARRLSIRSNTARTHVQNLLTKLRVHTRLEAVTLAMRHTLPDDGAVERNWPKANLYQPQYLPTISSKEATK